MGYFLLSSAAALRASRSRCAASLACRRSPSAASRRRFISARCFSLRGAGGVGGGGVCARASGVRSRLMIAARLPRGAVEPWACTEMHAAAAASSQRPGARPPHEMEAWWPAMAVPPSRSSPRAHTQCAPRWPAPKPRKPHEARTGRARHARAHPSSALVACARALCAAASFLRASSAACVAACAWWGCGAPALRQSSSHSGRVEQTGHDPGVRVSLTLARLQGLGPAWQGRAADAGAMPPPDSSPNPPPQARCPTHLHGRGVGHLGWLGGIGRLGGFGLLLAHVALPALPVVQWGRDAARIKEKRRQGTLPPAVLQS